MKLSIDVPDEWGKLLRDAAYMADAQSVQDYLRALIADDLGVEKPDKTWGGKRQAKQKGSADQATSSEKIQTEIDDLNNMTGQIVS